jgi:hypothetical protein
VDNVRTVSEVDEECRRSGSNKNCVHERREMRLSTDISIHAGRIWIPAFRHKSFLKKKMAEAEASA